MDLSVHSIQSEASGTPDTEDMVFFSLPTHFRISTCMRRGQLTPPPSSDDETPATVKTRCIPTLATTKQIAKQPKNAKNQTSLARSLSQNCHSSWVSHYRQTDEQLPYAECVPPEDAKSHSRPEAVSDNLSPVELRRTFSSYHNLRGLARRQSHSSPLLSPPCPSRSILPNPATKGHISDGPLHSSSPLRSDKKDPSYTSYEDLHILSCYEEAQGVPTEHKRDGQKDTLTASGHCSNHQTGDSVGRSRKKPSDSSIESNESGWLANTTSREQRLRRFKSRCFQVVQTPSHRHTRGDSDNEKIMLATMVVGPGKPKLVQIDRPSLPNSSASSRRSSRVQSTQSLPSRGSASAVVPSTPLQHQEISAFSPYDTPPDVSAPLRHTLLQQTCVEQTPVTASKLHLVPQPLSIPCPSPERANVPPHHALAEPISFSSTQPRHTPSPTSSTSTRSSPRLLHTSNEHPTPSPRDLDSVIAAVAASINHFPNHMPNLTSPWVLTLLTLLPRPLLPTHARRKTETYLSHLHPIFPRTPRDLTSIIAAWVLVDLFLSRLVCSPATTATATAIANTYAGILVARARALQPGVAVVAQRLLDAVRGPGGWDPGLWAALRVLATVDVDVDVDVVVGDGEGQGVWA